MDEKLGVELWPLKMRNTEEANELALWEWLSDREEIDNKSIRRVFDRASAFCGALLFVNVDMYFGSCTPFCRE